MGKAKKILGVIGIIILSFVIVIGIKLSNVYDADDTAYEATRNDDTVKVREVDYGWYFNGPSEDDALIFYPGTMVDEMAYAPLAHKIAAEGMDVCVVAMPIHNPLVGKKKAKDPMEQHSYKNWYIGGHSLGGAMAGEYASSNPYDFKGVVMLAGYPTEKIDDSQKLLLIYGTEDGIIDRQQFLKSEDYYPKEVRIEEMKGANYSQFGNYGTQKGDFKAKISSKEQQKKTAKLIVKYMLGK